MIGIRELKNHLSKYLQEVKRGTIIQITEWGNAVARLIPAPKENEEDAIRRLVKAGLIDWNGGKPQGAKHPIKIKGKPASQWILENRR